MSMEATPTYRQKEKRYMIWALKPDGKRGKAAYGKTEETCLAKKREIEQEYKDAQQVLQAIQDHEFEIGSLAWFVYDIWEPRTYAEGRVHIATKQKYDIQVKLHLLPAPMPDGRTLGEYQTTEIGIKEFTFLKAGLRRYKRVPKSHPPRYERTDEPLSASEQREVLLRGREILNLHNRIKAATGERTREDWRIVDLPKKPKKKVRPPLPLGFAVKLIATAVASGTPWMAGHLFAAQCLAIREGESCALCKEDLDEENGTLHIQRQRRYIDKEQGFQDVPLKSDESDRFIHVTPELIAMLKKFWDPESAKYMFTNNARGPCSPRALCELTPKLCAKAGLPIVGFHDLRSYASTNLYEMGTDVYTIKGILGHASIDETLIYLNERPAPQRAAFARMDAWFSAIDKAVEAARRAAS